MLRSDGKLHAVLHRLRSLKTRRLVLLLLLATISVGLQVALTYAQNIGGCGYGYGYGCSVQCVGYIGYDGYRYVGCDGYVGCDAYGYASCNGTVGADGYVDCNVRRDGYPDVRGDAYIACDGIRCDAYLTCPAVGCDGYPDDTGGEGCTGVGCDGYSGTADLIVTSFDAPDIAGPNEAIDISWTVENVGSAPLSGTNNLAGVCCVMEMIWLQDDADFNISEGGGLAMTVYPGTTEVDATFVLDPGESYSVTATVTLPDRTGVYYLIVDENVFNYGGEADLSNNQLARQIMLTDGLPDLRPNYLSSPAEVMPGESFWVRWEGINQGGGVAYSVDGWLESLYISSDSQLDESDQLLASTTALSNQVAPGESYVVWHEEAVGAYVSISDMAGLDFGTNYLLIEADSAGAISESDESNNVLAVPINITEGPDLDRPWLKPIPDVLYVGDTIPLEWSVQNIGTAPVLPRGCTQYDRVYVSSDTELGSPDTFIASEAAPNFLAPYDFYVSERAAGEFTIPSFIPPVHHLDGDYYLLAVTDYNNCVFESDETNNIGVYPVEFRPRPSADPQAPDLTVTNLDVATYVHEGATKTVRWTVRNIGSGSGGSWHDAVYLSTDETVDAGDAALGSQFHVGQLLNNETYDATMSVDIPAGTPEGEYKLIVRTDDNAANAEYNYSNNTLAQSIVVDNTPMDISNVQVVPACDGAIVSYETSEPAESFIHWYDATGWHYEYDSRLKTSHSLTLTGFPAGSTNDVMIVALDRANNAAEHEVRFRATIGKPALSLGFDRVYWQDYAQFEQRMLSVDYSLSNTGSTGAADVTVVQATNTNGVMLASPAPHAIGHIAGGETAAFTLKYLVPPHVQRFTSRLQVSADDACGTGFTYP